MLVRLAAVACCLLTVIYVVLGFVAPPPQNPRAMDALLRIALTTVVCVTLSVGPGLALAVLGRLPSGAGLGVLPLPGLLLLGCTGLAAWLLAGHIQTHVTAGVLLAAIALALLPVAAISRPSSMPTRAVAAMSVLFALLIIVVGRDLYSVGPPGELYGGMVSRTYEASNRPDSRIPYHVVQLIANGVDPHSAAGEQNFRPYSFADRGPIAGLMAAPIVLASGAVVPTGLPGEPWHPFDQQGFAVYRLAIETFTIAAMLAVYALLVLLAGQGPALFALLLTVGTPFVVHETYFTWPKVLTACLVVLAGQWVIQGRPARAGLLAGAAYLVHPLALLSLPGLALLWLVVSAKRGFRSDRVAVLVGLGVMALGLVAWLGFWRLVNAGDFHQAGFLQYLIEANTVPAPSLHAWFASRLESAANTLVPMHLYLTHASDPFANPITGQGPAIVRFYLQYWTALPFAVGILFYPLLLVVLGRTAFRFPWVFAAVVAAPFLTFTVYWGSFDTGLMREGLHAWLLTILIVYGWYRFKSDWRPPLERWILLSRVPETLLMVLLPSIWGGHQLVSASFRVTDIVGLIAMVMGTAWLGWQTWCGTGPSSMHVGLEQKARRSGAMAGFKD